MASNAPSLNSAAIPFWVRAAQAIFFPVIHFICPLIFFTHFTRNPYQTQISLLHVSILILLVVWAVAALAGKNANRGRSSELRAAAPFLIFTAFAASTSVYSWWSHPVFFRDSILAEGLRVNLFWLINVVGAAGVGVMAGRRIKGRSDWWEPDIPVFFAGACFAACWFFYAKVRTPAPHPMTDSIAAFLIDPYGLFVWAAALAFMIYRCASKGIMVLFSVNFLVGALASLYGVGQYFGWDAIWPRTMNPYGARAISTFGNPNFLSPYLVLLIPLAFIGYSRAAKLSSRLFWGSLCLIYEAGLLATLTRSSWMGALAAIAAALWVVYRSQRPSSTKVAHAVLAVCALALFLSWPTGLRGQVQQSPLKRLAETSEIFQKTEDPKSVYQPFFQRFLIWSVCWNFAQERPLLGKGWGMLELFFPFYQGSLLYQNRFERLRTHANNGHNEVIEIWTQTGIIGMGLAVWFFAVFFIWGWRNLRCLEHPESRLFAAGLLAGAAGVLVDNLLNVSLHFAVPGYLFWWQAGLLIAVFPGTSREASSAGRSRFFWAPVVILFCVWAGVRSVKFWMSEFYYFRGFILHRENQLKPALDRLMKSWQLFPMEVNRNYELGNVYARLGDMERAVWAYTEAIRANAGYDEIYFNRGTLLASRGDWDAAHKDYLTSLSINPVHYPAYTGLSNLYMRDPKAHAEKAVRALERAVYFFPKDKDMLNNLGSFLTHSKGSGAGAPYFLRAVEADPNYAVAQRNLGSEIRSLAQKGEKEKAREFLKRWRELIPGVPQDGFFGL